MNPLHLTLLFLLLCTYIHTNCPPGYSGDQCQFSICTQNIISSSWDNALISNVQAQSFQDLSPQLQVVIPENAFYWDSAVMVIRVESRGVSNSGGTSTHFRLLVDNEEIAQAHIAHRNSNLEEVIFFGATTVQKGVHEVKVQCKVSSGTAIFEDLVSGDEQFIYVMLFPENDATFASWTNVPSPTASDSWTSSPLNMNVGLQVSEACTLHAIAGLSRVSQTSGGKNTRYRILIDGNQAAETNTGFDHRGQLRKYIAFTASSNVTSPGNYDIGVQYQTASGVAETWTDGADGAQYRTLIAFKSPTTHSVQGTWTNPFSQLTVIYSNISPSMEVTLTTPEGYLFVTAEISRIDATLLPATISFILLIDDVPVSETNVYIHPTVLLLGDDTYKMVTFSGIKKVSAQQHTVKVQAKCAEDLINILSFSSDANGYQLRRLSAIVFPTVPEEDSTTCCGPFNSHNCSQPICFGKSLPDNPPCSGVGICTPPSTCSCPSGQYTGAECEFPICYSKPSNDPSACSSHGQCIKPNTCSCETGWTGDQCEIPVCFGQNAGTPGVCSGHGTCIEPDTCQCASGYTGDQCQYPVCYGKSSNDDDVCSSHGSCIAPDDCQCENGYTGDNCELAICFGKVQSVDPDVCSSRGYCSSPDNCECNDGYTGQECETPICFSKLANDPTVCNSRGQCIAKDTCICEEEYSGPQCELLGGTCFGKNHTDPLVCSGHGYCNVSGTCLCAHGYIGEECQLAVCNNLNSSDSMVCSGRGSCVAPDTCSCTEPSNWGGHDCQYPICFGKLSINSLVCSGHGICSEPNMCDCVPPESYTGNECQYPICFGKDASDPTVCSSHGDCSAPETCVCHNGYDGVECQWECQSASIVSTRFNLDGSRIIITFSNHMNTTETHSCMEIFQDSNSKLGSNAICAFTNSTVLEITPDKKVIAGDTVTLNPDILKAYGPCGYFLDMQTLTIEAPVAAPTVFLNAAQQLAQCQPLVLESIISGYGDLQLSWNHLSGGNYQFSQEIADLLENTSNTTIEIPPHLIPAGLLKFQLIVTDIFGQESSVFVVVEKISNSHNPQLHIHTGPHITTNRFTPLVLQVHVKFPECIPHTGMALMNSWTSDQDVPLDSSRYTPSLYIAPYTLQPEEIYQFTLHSTLVSLVNDEELGAANATITVNVTQSPLVAEISGGKERFISADGILRIDALGSYDPDYQYGIPPHANWEWKCCTQGDNDCDYLDCNQKFSDILISSPVLEKGSNLPTGTYRFELTFSVGERKAHDFITITIQGGQFPNVQIRISSDSYPTHNAKRPLILHGTVLNDIANFISYKWYVESGNLVLDETTAPYGTENRELYIAADVLHEPEYRFRFSATNEAGTGHAYITIKVALPPTGGSIFVHPTGGTIRSLVDKVTLFTSGWISTIDQLPLRYIFYMKEGDLKIPLNVIPTDHTSLPSFIMPFVDKPISIRFIVSAFGKNGVAGEAISAPIQVEPYSISPTFGITFAEQLFNESYHILMEEKNFDDTDRLVHSAARILQGTKSNSTEEMIHQRKILIEKLIDFYASAFKSSVKLFNSASRIKVSSTLSMLASDSKELEQQGANHAIEMLSNLFNISSSLEPIPYSTAHDAFNIISQTLKVTTGSENIRETLSNIAALHMLDMASGNSLNFASDTIRLTQSRTLLEKSYGNAVAQNYTDSASLTIYDGTFDNIDAEQKQKLSAINMRIVQWKKNYRSTTSSISSDIISAELVDNDGKNIKIQKVGKDPIEIKIFSSYITSTSVCRYYDENEKQWKDVPVKARLVGRWIICASEHLTDFAIFEPDEAPHNDSPSWDKNLLWFLMSLIVIPVVGVVVFAIVLVIRIQKRRREAEAKRIKVELASYRELSLME